MSHEHKKSFRATNIIVGYFPIHIQVKSNSIYRKLLNRFLHRVKDVGLYHRWTKGAFSKAVKMKYGSFKINYTFANIRTFNEISRIQAIDLAFIQCGVWLLGGGCFLSGIVFFWEYFFGMKFKKLLIVPIV